MTDTQNNPDPITHAARLLREAAEELRQAHTLSSDRNNWIGEPEAKAAYDEHMAAAQALEDWEAAVGAGGVQSLSQKKATPASVDKAQAAINSGASGGVQALSAAQAVAAPTAPTSEHIAAMERAWLWMDNQADQQSKGGHATFDLMMLRQERDALREAIDGSQPTSCAHCHGSGEVLLHTDDCDDELCALNGDQHSCAGKVEDCQCVAPIAASPTSPALSAAPAVPNEPTNEMYRAAQKIALPYDDDGGTIILNTSQIRAIWHAMLAASPTPTPPAEGITVDEFRPCPCCFGAGVEGTADDYGHTIDVACGECNGSGRDSKPTPPAEQQAPATQETGEAHAAWAAFERIASNHGPGDTDAEVKVRDYLMRAARVGCYRDAPQQAAPKAAPGEPIKRGQWAWLPIEPTTGMLIAGNHGQPGDFSALKVWQDMIAALDRSADYTRPIDPPFVTIEPVGTPLGMYEHKCQNVTGHRGPSFVCQKAGQAVSQNSYCNNCHEAAPQQEAQEPVGEVQHLHELNDSWLNKLPIGTKLYTAPQPAPAPLSDDTERLREALQRIEGASMSMYATRSDMLEHCQDIARAALAAQGGQ